MQSFRIIDRYNCICMFTVPWKPSNMLQHGVTLLMLQEKNPTRVIWSILSDLTINFLFLSPALSNPSPNKWQTCWKAKVKIWFESVPVPGQQFRAIDSNSKQILCTHTHTHTHYGHARFLMVTRQIADAALNLHFLFYKVSFMRFQYFITISHHAI